MPRVVHFEIHAENPQRAMTFYGRLFGWQFMQYAEYDYWQVTTGPASTPGIDGGLMPRKGKIDGEAVIAYVCTVGVDDLDQSMNAVEAAGGRIVVEKMAIPGIGWSAYAKDTEGNVFGMFKSDASAR